MEGYTNKPDPEIMKELLLRGIKEHTHCRCDFIPKYLIPEYWRSRAIQNNQKMCLERKKEFPEKRVYNQNCWKHTVIAFLNDINPAEHIPDIKIGDRVSYEGRKATVVEPDKEQTIKMEPYQVVIQLDNFITFDGIPHSRWIASLYSLKK